MALKMKTILIIKYFLLSIIFCISLPLSAQQTDKDVTIDNNQIVIKTFPNGLYGSNCYVVHCQNVGFIVDAGSNDPSIFKYITENKIDIKNIFCTHSHIDHVLYVMNLKEFTDAKICLGAEDVNHFKYYSNERIEEWTKNGDISEEQLQAIDKFIKIKYDSLLNGNEFFTIGEMKVEILQTPGHSKGSISLLVNGLYLFSGDTIMDNLIGNTDVDSGNENDIIKSINEKILPLEDKIEIFQGHGEKISMKEIRNVLNLTK